jgi:hypothetical protein
VRSHLAVLVATLALTVSTLAPTSLLAPASAAGAAGAASSTRILEVSPVTAADTLKPGYKLGPILHGGNCEAGSDVISGVYRCFAGNGVYDPCWPDTASPTIPDVVCLLEPWSHTVVRIYVTAPLQPSPAGRLYVWGVQLATGQRCLAAQGTHDLFDGQVVNYECSGSYRLVLLGQPNRSRPAWRIREAYLHTKTGRYTYGPTVTIAVAWYGLPSTPAPR